MREKKRKRWTAQYKADENRDLNDRELYPVMPSPAGIHWLDYIRHKLKMMDHSIAVYTTDKYTRLNVDKYIESNREIDGICARVVDYQAAVVYFGAAEIPPNLPFHIKNHVRAPRSRKMMNGFKRRGNVYIVPTDEYFTSQTCAECFSRFDPATRRNRFKVCRECRPDQAAMLPKLIIAPLGKRDLRAFRDLDRQMFNEIRTKKSTFHKKQWTPDVKKTFWNRDIVAAKCILIKGIFR